MAAVVTQGTQAKSPRPADQDAVDAFNHGRDFMETLVANVEEAFNQLYEIFVTDPTKRKSPLDVKISRGPLSLVNVSGVEYRASMQQTVSLSDAKLRQIEFNPKFKVNYQSSGGNIASGRLYCVLRVFFVKDGDNSFKIASAYLYHGVTFGAKQKTYAYAETDTRELNIDAGECAADFLVDAKLVITKSDATAAAIKEGLKTWADDCPPGFRGRRKTIEITGDSPPEDGVALREALNEGMEEVFGDSAGGDARDGRGVAIETQGRSPAGSRSGGTISDVGATVGTRPTPSGAGGGARAANGVKFFENGETRETFFIGDRSRKRSWGVVEVKKMGEHKLQWRHPSREKFHTVDIYTDEGGDEFFKLEFEDNTVLDVYYRWRNPRGPPAKLYEQQPVKTSGHKGGGAAKPLLGGDKQEGRKRPGQPDGGPGAKKAALARILNEAETLALGGHTLFADTARSIVEDVEMGPGELSEKMTAVDFARMFRLRGGRLIPFELAGANGSGSRGTIAHGIAEGRKVVIKIQKDEDGARDRIGIAGQLMDAGCELVKFRALMRGGFIVTIMEGMDGDCYTLEPQKFKEGNFKSLFWEPLWGCLKEKKLSLTDMKLENIGYATIGGRTVFRLLDLDAIGEPVSTYPAKREFTTFKAGETQKATTQTIYAFWLALLASYLLKKDRQDLLRLFFHGSFVEPTKDRANRSYKRPDERLHLLDTLRDRYRSDPGVAEAAGNIEGLMKSAYGDLAFWVSRLASYLLVEADRRNLLLHFSENSYLERMFGQPNTLYKSPEKRLGLLDTLALFYKSDPKIMRAIEKIKRLLPKGRKANDDGGGARLGKRQPR